MTEQETFDTVVAHARKQQCKSVDGSGLCLYRGPDGAMCFAGCLIDDYLPEMEGKSLGSNTVCHYFSSRGYNTALVSRLQRVHDCYDVSDWEFCFKQIAVNYRLQYKEPV